MFALAVQHGVKSLRMFPPPFQKGCGRMKKKSTRLLRYAQKRVLCSEFSSVVRGETVLMLSTCARFTVAGKTPDWTDGIDLVEARFTVAGINSRQKDTAFSEKRIKRHTPAPPN